MLWLMKLDVFYHVLNLTNMALSTEEFQFLIFLNISFFFTVSSTTYTEGLDCWTKKMSWTHTHTHTRNGQELRTRSIFVSQIIKKSFTITQGVHVRSTSRPQLKISHTKSSHTSRRARNSLPLNLFHVYYWCHLVTEKSTANLVTYFFFLVKFGNIYVPAIDYYY